jgi:hypothetical protein
MNQSLDMQVAALIFLAGTKSLVTSTDTGVVEMMSDNEELDEPAPISPLRNRAPPSPSKPVCVGVVAHWDRQIF